MYGLRLLTCFMYQYDSWLARGRRNIICVSVLTFLYTNASGSESQIIDKNVWPYPCSHMPDLGGRCAAHALPPPGRCAARALPPGRLHRMCFCVQRVMSWILPGLPVSVHRRASHTLPFSYASHYCPFHRRLSALAAIAQLCGNRPRCYQVLLLVLIVCFHILILVLILMHMKTNH